MAPSKMVSQVSVSNAPSARISYNNVDGNLVAKYLLLGGLVVICTLFAVTKVGKVL